MRAAVLARLGAPVHGDFEEPVADGEQIVLDVLAAGVNHLDVGICAGAVPGLAPMLPSVAGSDGVGRASDGRRFFFDTPIRPFGALAERTLVRPSELLPVHDDVDSVTAAALGNAGIAATISILWRASLQPGEKVLVLGATGAVGQIAVQLARVTGAERVVGVARDPERLNALKDRGADAVVALDVGAEQLHERILEAAGGPVDVIIDMLWGSVALAAMKAAAVGARLVQVGQQAGAESMLPSALVRGRRLVIAGTASGLEPRPVRAEAYERLLALVAAGEVTVNVDARPLAQVGEAWKRQVAGPTQKQVLVPTRAVHSAS